MTEFQGNHGILLGMAREKIIVILGPPDEKTDNKVQAQLKYNRAQEDSCELAYSATYTLKENRLVKFEFLCEMP